MTEPFNMWTAPPNARCPLLEGLPTDGDVSPVRGEAVARAEKLANERYHGRISPEILMMVVD